MVQAINPSITSRFHNLSNEALADELGHADALLKGAEAECKALKDEIKRRGCSSYAAKNFAIRVAEQISGWLDVAAVKEYLGNSWRRFEVATVSTVIRTRRSSGSCKRPDVLPNIACIAHGRTPWVTPQRFNIRERSCPKQNRNP